MDANEEAGAPRWVKIFGAVALVFVLVFAALHLTGRGFGPGMHGHGGGHDVADAGTAP